MAGFKDLRISSEMVTPFYGGLKFVETETAMAKPSAKPRTDDMRDMVEHMDRLGLIQSKPAAFVHRDTCFIHPALLAKLRSRISTHFDDLVYKAMLRG